MPYLITQTWFPLSKADEVGKKYLEVLEKFPPDESLGKDLIPSAVTSDQNGLTSVSILEVKQDKMFDAFDRAAKSILEFRTIEGYNYNIRFWLTAEEALESIGLG